MRQYWELKKVPMSEWTDEELHAQLLAQTTPQENRRGEHQQRSRQANMAQVAQRVGDEIRRRLG